MHLTAICSRYPEFKFVVSAIRTGLRSGIVKFNGGHLCTRTSGYTEQEAGAILEALKKMCLTPPIYDQEIKVWVEEAFSGSEESKPVKKKSPY